MWKARIKAIMAVLTLMLLVGIGGYMVFGSLSISFFTEEEHQEVRELIYQHDTRQPPYIEDISKAIKNLKLEV